MMRSHRVAGTQHPETLATLDRPWSHAAIREAELRMGLDLPREMRQWLPANDIDAGRQPDGRSCLVAPGCDVGVRSQEMLDRLSSGHG